MIKRIIKIICVVIVIIMGYIYDNTLTTVTLQNNRRIGK